MPNPIPPPFYARHFRFRQNELAGEPFPPAQVDVELDALMQSVNQAITVLRNITDATGRLRLQVPLREMRLIEILAYVATAGQTSFYLAPVTDPLTDLAEVRINTTGSLYSIVDATKVTVAAYTGTGTVSATLGSSTYTTSATVPNPVVGARLTVAGTDAGLVTARPTANTVQTDTPWPLANVAGAALAWVNLATATLSGVAPAFVGGEKVQIAIYSDGDGALSQLGSASTTRGARLVAVYDAGNVLGANNVEDALQELATLMYGLESSLGPLDQYLKADGTVAMDADLNGGGNKAVGWAPGTAAGELVTYDQISTLIGIWNDLQQYYLKRDGSTQMNADLPLGSHKVVGMLAGVGPLDGVNVTQLGERIHKDGSVAMAADLQLGGHKIVDLSPGTNPTDAVILSQLTSLAGTNLTVYFQSVPGTYPFVVPTGVTQLRVKLWGPGGLGATSILANGIAAGGGGGGACIEGVMAVTAGETLTIVIAGGGSGLPSQILRAGVPQISAGGGASGSYTYNQPAPGGLGGVPVNDAGLPNMVLYAGQQGGSGLAYFGGPSFCIGGGGGSAGGGGGGGGTAGHQQIDSGTFSAGGVGAWPGGGGGGGTGGGVGSPGGIVITY
jgi:hypothetical protein